MNIFVFISIFIIKKFIKQEGVKPIGLAALGASLNLIGATS